MFAVFKQIVKKFNAIADTKNFRTYTTEGVAFTNTH